LVDRSATAGGEEDASQGSFLDETLGYSNLRVIRRGHLEVPGPRHALIVVAVVNVGRSPDVIVE